MKKMRVWESLLYIRFVVFLGIVAFIWFTAETWDAFAHKLLIAHLTIITTTTLIALLVRYHTDWIQKRTEKMLWALGLLNLMYFAAAWLGNSPNAQTVPAFILLAINTTLTSSKAHESAVWWDR
jgi:ABC-type transport system involved in cytochrome bd biosynthesis fused ATPase/permease subunit